MSLKLRDACPWLALAVAGMLAGCGIPNSMQYAAGVEPKSEDDNVRFRTIYYFRVFDYCDRPEQSAVPPGSQAFPYSDSGVRHIQKDSLYRFRMTGKASSLFSRVHFESGTLKAHQIDPFGADIAYDETNRNFYVRSAEDTQTQARFASALARIEDTRRLAEKFEGGAKDDAISRLRAQIQALDTGTGYAAPADRVGRALAAHRAAVAAARKFDEDVENFNKDAKARDAKAKLLTFAAVTPANADTTMGALAVAVVQNFAPGAAAIINDLSALRASARTAAKATDALLAERNKLFEDFQAASNAASRDRDKRVSFETASENRAKADAIDQSAKMLLAALDAQIAELGRAIGGEAPVAAGRVQSDECPPGSRFKRGFQVLGPEGLRTFDPDDRLMMAMSTDAKPLIAALNEISGRVLGEKLSPAATRLPASEERVAILTARRAIDGAAASEAGDAAALIDEAIKALGGTPPGASK